MKIVINFLLRKNRESADNKFPVYVRFTLKNNRVELSTGIFISKDHWDESKQRIKGKYQEVVSPMNDWIKCQLKSRISIINYGLSVKSLMHHNQKQTS